MFASIVSGKVLEFTPQTLNVPPHPHFTLLPSALRDARPIYILRSLRAPLLAFTIVEVLVRLTICHTIAIFVALGVIQSSSSGAISGRRARALTCPSLLPSNNLTQLGVFPIANTGPAVWSAWKLPSQTLSTVSPAFHRHMPLTATRMCPAPLCPMFTQRLPNWQNQAATSNANHSASNVLAPTNRTSDVCSCIQRMQENTSLSRLILSNETLCLSAANDFTQPR